MQSKKRKRILIRYIQILDKKMNHRKNKDNLRKENIWFIFRDNCIFQLHSSVLPELNEDLLYISGTR